ncbi:TnsA-like heteromeric transposase endonuclease subunit [Streptomyces sp. NPDC085481]|uniref:TnsA-like heteromeric transposase endonuclease subunit n=1 Tax=Streptomyces sp. NPDC085481 TaxID=3365727 RepID=UPI0037CD3BD7
MGIASQPFWLHWHDGERERRHAPDYFVRRADGSAGVVDVRADERIEPRDAEVFEVTRLACRQAGWGFERVGVPEEVLLANVRWLSRYRHPRCRRGPVVDRLREAFAAPVPLMVRNGVIRADLTLRPAAEARRTTPISGAAVLRPMWDIGHLSPTGGRAVSIASLCVENMPVLEPGGRATVRLVPLTPSQWTHVQPGQRITMHEDRTTAGVLFQISVGRVRF